MALPTKDQISLAIESQKNILDSTLNGFKAVDGIIGPECYSGGFCLVFPISNGTQKYAFRVWHTEIDGIKERLAKIASYLKTNKIRYFVDFDFIENGLNVPTEDSSTIIEAIKMKWVSGKNLSEYIEYLINESGLSISECKDKISELADNFFKMIKELHSFGISHGDLQHGNIMIDENEQIILVDYDSVYVPSFTTELQITSGMAAYQHPSRKNNLTIAGSKDDYFSERIIYLSLLALAEDPDLWNSLKNEEGDKDEYSFLLTEKDLENFKNSELYSKIYRLSNPYIKILCDDIEKSLSSADTSHLIKLEDLLINKYETAPSSISLTLEELNDFITIEKPSYKNPIVKKEIFDKNSAIKRYSQN